MRGKGYIMVEAAVRTGKWGDQKEGVYIDEASRRHRRPVKKPRS